VCLRIASSLCEALDKSTPFSEPWDPVPVSSVERPLYGPLSFYGDNSSFPAELVDSLGSPFGSRPVYGDDSALRKAVDEARDFETTGKVL
jgi:hypothetical protein